jgi:hypothetical protein
MLEVLNCNTFGFRTKGLCTAAEMKKWEKEKTKKKNNKSRRRTRRRRRG